MISLVKIFIFCFLLFYCSESKTTRNANKANSTSAIPAKSEEEKKDTDSEVVFEDQESSSEVKVEENELGISINAPKGMLSLGVTPKINVEPLRSAFTTSLPGNAVILGNKGATVSLENSDVENKHFADNFNLKYQIANNEIKDNIAIAIRTMDDDGQETLRVVTQGDININKGEEFSELTFKAGGKTIDVQPVELLNEKLSDMDVYFPLPKNPQKVECMADSAFSAYLSWGIPGGSVAAYKVIKYSSEADANSDIGCKGTIIGSELPGTTRSYTVE